MPQREKLLKFKLEDCNHDFIIASKGCDFYKVRANGVHLADVSIIGVTYHHTPFIIDPDSVQILTDYILELIDYL